MVVSMDKGGKALGRWTIVTNGTPTGITVPNGFLFELEVTFTSLKNVPTWTEEQQLLDGWCPCSPVRAARSSRRSRAQLPPYVDPCVPGVNTSRIESQRFNSKDVRPRAPGLKAATTGEWSP